MVPSLPFQIGCIRIRRLFAPLFPWNGTWDEHDHICFELTAKTRQGFELFALSHFKANSRWIGARFFHAGLICIHRVVNDYDQMQD
jgi:hypothetical protein